jgi:hypothetical protein
MRMPKGLKNASSMICRMTKATLRDQIYRNIFTYVDNIVVASKMKITQIDDLVETFANMHGAQLKLNPEKYYQCPTQTETHLGGFHYQISTTSAKASRGGGTLCLAR